MAYTKLIVRNGRHHIRHYNEYLLKKNNQKYQTVPLMINGKQKLFYVHRLVAEAFIPNPENLPEVNHINENKTDNRVENLEWCTRNYNINYGTGRFRAYQTKVNKGIWTDYRNMPEKEKNEIQKNKNKEYYHEYYHKHKEEIREHQKNYYVNNKDKYSEYAQKNYWNNRICKVKWYYKNRDYALEWQRNYDRTHYIHKRCHEYYVYMIDGDECRLLGVYRTFKEISEHFCISTPTIRSRIIDGSLKPIKKKYIVSNKKIS